MFAKIEQFLKDLQAQNWGFPWHVSLAGYGEILGAGILAILIPQAHPLWCVIGAAFIVFIIGYAYEIWQKKKRNVTKTDQIQDLIANFIGILAGGLNIYFILINL